MRKRILLVVLVLLMGIVPTSAQDVSNPLLDLLARVPDTAAARQYLTYADYQAIFASYPGATRPTSYQSFADLTGDSSTEGRAVMGSLMSIGSGPQLFQNGLRSGDAIATTMGFDLFSIDRAIDFGNPPATVTMIEGDFDPDAVIAAHEARGFVASEINGLTLLCGAAGCDAGMDANLKGVDPANIFGGKLGRSQPTLVGDNLIASSASIDAIDATASTISGDSANLADQPDYRAAAEAISAQGTLMQAYFIAPDAIVPAPDAPASAASLPPYTLIAIADTATGDQEQALVALVYADQASAEAAAALFPDLLTTAQSLRTRQAWGDLLDGRGMTSIEANVFTPSVDRAVLVLTLSAPLISADAQTSSSTPTIDRIYGVLANAYFARDLSWLATTP